MDEAYLMATVRYTEINPVRARLCRLPGDWVWSSTRAHFQEKDDYVVTVKPMLDRVDNWSEYLSIKESSTNLAMIRQHTRTGRPVGSESFIESLETLTGMALKKGKPGPKPRIK